MRLRAKVDDNQAEIVKALREAGCSVQSLAAIGKGCPDLLIADPRGILHLAEIKDGSKPASARKLTPDQVKWHTGWRSIVHVVETVDDALAIAAGSWIKRL